MRGAGRRGAEEGGLTAEGDKAAAVALDVLLDEEHDELCPGSYGRCEVSGCGSNEDTSSSRSSLSRGLDGQGLTR